MFASMRNDIRVIKQRDPAVKNTLEVVLCYSGLHAIWAYRLSHFFYKRSWFVTARFISTLARLAIQEKLRRENLAEEQRIL